MSLLSLGNIVRLSPEQGLEVRMPSKCKSVKLPEKPTTSKSLPVRLHLKCSVALTEVTQLSPNDHRKLYTYLLLNKGAKIILLTVKTVTFKSKDQYNLLHTINNYIRFKEKMNVVKF